MPKYYYQYGEEIGIYPTPEIGAFSIGSVAATIADTGSQALTISGTYSGAKDVNYNIFINTTGSSPNTINWNEDVTNPVKDITLMSRVGSTNIVTAYSKAHGYSTNDYIRVFGASVLNVKNVQITVVDENKFTFTLSGGDQASDTGSCWKWNAQNVNASANISLSNGLSADMLTSDSYGTNDFFTFKVSNTTGKTIRTHYFKEPNVLALSTDTPQIKKEHHEGLVMYACKQITRRIDVNRYPIYSQEWEEWYNKIVSSGKYIREENVQSTFRNY
jgi:hypothetical protein